MSAAMFVAYPGAPLGRPSFAVKDSIDVAGLPTRLGSRAYADAMAARANAPVIDALLHGGWHLVGKTTMHELAFGVTGLNAYAGTPLNPQDPQRVPGGSSSGSAAAVGAGVVDLALGTDTGGSVRVPAACCGVIGLKPSFGRVSRIGVHPDASSLDCVGPFARSMDLLVQAMGLLAPGFRPAAVPTAAKVALLQVEADAQVRAAINNALARSGWQVHPATIASFEAAFAAGLTIINRETWGAYGHLTGRGLLAADVETRLKAAGDTGDVAVTQAEQVRREFSAAVDRLLADHDALVLPTLPELPPKVADVRAGLPVLRMTALVRPFNLSGHPALSLPVPLGNSGNSGNSGGLMAGLQIIGRHGADEQVCALGRALERALAASQ